MKRALVTLVIGKRHQRVFDSFCRSLWNAYAERHHFDLVVISRALDESPRARSRNPSWQKCLIPSLPEITPFDQVVWIDADIMINPKSPDIGLQVPVECIGAVDAFATPSREDFDILIRRKYAHWSARSVPYISNVTPTEYHAQFGLAGQFDSVVQAGVLVLSPRFHAQVFQHVYHHYEDKGKPEWNAEMRPLSYEILSNRLQHWISPKFNMPWSSVKALYYPFIYSHRAGFIQRALRKTGLRQGSRLSRKCATIAFLNNFFLHFAGETEDMALVDPKTTL